MVVLPEIGPMPYERPQNSLALGYQNEEVKTVTVDLAFDAVMVAEDLRCYKPDTTAFTRSLEAAQARPDEILHVAFGFKYDIGPAQAAGSRAAWVNRHREPPPGDAVPDYEWTDLWGLAELAAGQTS